jgi:MYXO-CTERM domain-containing protein
MHSTRSSIRAIRPLALAVPALVLLLTGEAGASPNYPDVVKDVAGSSCAPTCLLCHKTNPGILGTAASAPQRPFLAAAMTGGMPALSLRMSDDQARAVFLRMRDGIDTNMNGVIDVGETPPSDSDMDGKTDFDELAEDINPNPGNEDLCEVQYGCGARMAPTPPNRSFAIFSSVAVALGLLGLTLRSRRAK